jgi:hypothetical protein
VAAPPGGGASAQPEGHFCLPSVGPTHIFTVQVEKVTEVLNKISFLNTQRTFEVWVLQRKDEHFFYAT